MRRASVSLSNPEGLHARPGALFTMTASSFECSVQVTKNGKSVNGKSVISLISLDCRVGEQITIVTDGPDEVEALQRLVALITADFATL